MMIEIIYINFVRYLLYKGKREKIEATISCDFVYWLGPLYCNKA